MTAPEVMRRMITGFVVTQAVYVMAKLGIADLLTRDLPTSVEAIAEQVSAQRDPLYRVLRLLAGLGLLSETQPGQFVLTDLGDTLTDDAPGSVRHAAIMFAELPYRASGAMLHTVLTGQTAFDHEFDAGHEHYLEAHPADAATFNTAMRQLTAIVDEEISAAIDLTCVEAIVDVGGGLGGLLVAVLRVNPHLRATLVEQGSVVEGARRTLSEAGFAERVNVVEGNIFERVPAASFYVMKSVLHAWPDREAAQILRTCLASAAVGGRICVVERVVPEDDALLYPKLNDLIMLTVTGGRERTTAEYRSLFEMAGLTLTDVRPTASGFSVLIATSAVSASQPIAEPR
ncbi:MAG: methyltransferase [Jatrophihabitantaceae bacterium]